MAKSGNDSVKNMLRDTIKLMCKNGLVYHEKFVIEGTIGVTIDDREIFLMSMNDLVTVDKAIPTPTTNIRPRRPPRKRATKSCDQIRPHNIIRLNIPSQPQGDKASSADKQNKSQQDHSESVDHPADPNSEENKDEHDGSGSRSGNVSPPRQHSDSEDDCILDENEEMAEMYDIDDSSCSVSEQHHPDDDHLYSFGESPVLEKVSFTAEDGTDNTVHTVLVSTDSGYGLRSEIITEPTREFDINSIKQELDTEQSVNRMCGQKRKVMTAGIEFSGCSGELKRKQYHAWCSICKKGFHKTADVVGHMYLHTGKRHYLCNSCGRQYRYQRGLDEHIKSKHQNIVKTEPAGSNDEEDFFVDWRAKKHKPRKRHNAFCPICNKGLHRKEDVVGHMFKHTGKRHYLCPHCGKQYRYKRGLTSHIGSKHEGGENAVKTEGKDTDDDESAESEEGEEEDEQLAEIGDDEVESDSEMILEIVPESVESLDDQEIFESKEGVVQQVERYIEAAEAGKQVILEFAHVSQTSEAETVIVEQIQH